MRIRYQLQPTNEDNLMVLRDHNGIRVVVDKDTNRMVGLWQYGTFYSLQELKEEIVQ